MGKRGGLHPPPLSGNLWEFGNVNKIFLETFFHSQAEIMKYLRMLKLQFLSTTINLLTKFHIAKYQSLPFVRLPGIV